MQKWPKIGFSALSETGVAAAPSQHLRAASFGVKDRDHQQANAGRSKLNGAAARPIVSGSWGSAYSAGSSTV